MFPVLPALYMPNFEISHDVDWAWKTTDWTDLTGARRESWLARNGEPYTYGSGRGERTYPAMEWSAIASNTLALLTKVIGGSLNCCMVNGYENEDNALGWHSDDSPEMDASHAIAVLSLGAEREIYFRPIGWKGEIPGNYKIKLEHGSLLVMLPHIQEKWQHKIPKHSAPCGKRVSFTYRHLLQIQHQPRTG